MSTLGATLPSNQVLFSAAYLLYIPAESSPFATCCSFLVQQTQKAR